MKSVIIPSHMVHHRSLLILGYCKWCKKSLLKDHLPTTLIIPKMDTKNTAHFKVDKFRELLPRIVNMFPRETPEGSLITPETQPPNSFPYFLSATVLHNALFSVAYHTSHSPNNALLKRYEASNAQIAILNWLTNCLPIHLSEI